LDDVSWVVRCMADMPATPDQEEHVVQEYGPDSSVKKQYVLSAHIFYYFPG
jgi:hypothetical protein